MADSTIHGLATEITTLTGDELSYVIDDPAGTPVDRKMSTDTMKKYAGAYARGTGSAASIWYGPVFQPTTSTVNASLLANYIISTPFMMPVSTTLTHLGMRHSVAGAGGGLMRIALYNVDANLKPTTLLADSGALATDATAPALIDVTISVAVTAGTWYALSFNTDDSTVGVGGGIPFSVHGNVIDSARATGLGGLYRAVTYAAFGDETSQTYGHLGGVNINCPWMGVK